MSANSIRDSAKLKALMEEIENMRPDSGYEASTSRIDNSLGDILKIDGAFSTCTVSPGPWSETSNRASDVSGTPAITGPRGRFGRRGLQGARGIQGVQGVIGPQGVQGVPGLGIRCEVPDFPKDPVVQGREYDIVLYGGDTEDGYGQSCLPGTKITSRAFAVEAGVRNLVSLGTGGEDGDVGSGGVTIGLGAVGSSYPLPDSSAPVGSSTTAIGSYAAANSGQDSFAIAIGTRAAASWIHSGTANDRQGEAAVAIGTEAGLGGYVDSNGFTKAGGRQGARALAIGRRAAAYKQDESAVAIGDEAGAGGDLLRSAQAARAVAIGSGAAATGQEGDAIAIGRQAGTVLSYPAETSQYGLRQGDGCIAIGTLAGSVDDLDLVSLQTSIDNVAIGREAAQIKTIGSSSIVEGYVAIGRRAGYCGMESGAIAVGALAGAAAAADIESIPYTRRGVDSVVIGNESANGVINLGHGAVCVGARYGKQVYYPDDRDIGKMSVGVGWQEPAVTGIPPTGRVGTRRRANTIAIGPRYETERPFSGSNDWPESLEQEAIAIGTNASIGIIGTGAIVIGTASAKYRLLDPRSISIGEGAGGSVFFAPPNSGGHVAIGPGAAAVGTAHSIAIGKDADAVHDRSVVLNASGSVLSSKKSDALYVKPVKENTVPIDTSSGDEYKDVWFVVRDPAQDVVTPPNNKIYEVQRSSFDHVRLNNLVTEDVTISQGTRLEGDWEVDGVQVDDEYVNIGGKLLVGLGTGSETKIEGGTITADVIASDTISTVNITVESVTAGRIDVNNVTAKHYTNTTAGIYNGPNNFLGNRLVVNGTLYLSGQASMTSGEPGTAEYMVVSGGTIDAREITANVIVAEIGASVGAHVDYMIPGTLTANQTLYVEESLGVRENTTTGTLTVAETYEIKERYSFVAGDLSSDEYSFVTDGTLSASQLIQCNTLSAHTVDTVELLVSDIHANNVICGRITCSADAVLESYAIFTTSSGVALTVVGDMNIFPGPLTVGGGTIIYASEVVSSLEGLPFRGVPNVDKLIQPRATAGGNSAGLGEYTVDTISANIPNIIGYPYESNQFSNANFVYNYPVPYNSDGSFTGKQVTVYGSQGSTQYLRLVPGVEIFSSVMDPEGIKLVSGAQSIDKATNPLIPTGYIGSESSGGAFQSNSYMRLGYHGKLVTEDTKDTVPVPITITAGWDVAATFTTGSLQLGQRSAFDPPYTGYNWRVGGPDQETPGYTQVGADALPHLSCGRLGVANELDVYPIDFLTITSGTSETQLVVEGSVQCDVYDQVGTLTVGTVVLAERVLPFVNPYSVTVGTASDDGGFILTASNGTRYRYSIDATGTPLLVHVVLGTACE